jgi:two-component system nitrogen regulation sensor histidine kinase GlnL
MVPSQNILEHLSVAVVMFDARLRLRYVNPAGEALFSISARQLRGRDATELFRCTGTDVPELFERAMGSGQSFTEREKSLTLPDGREVTVDCTVTPLTGPNGTGGLLVELQQLDRQLRISREEGLFAQHQAARALVRGLAHEIKNPLGGLRGAAQLLERELAEPGLAEYTRVIIDEADRLQVLVDRLLGPNRLPTYTMINLHQVLERVYALVSAEVGMQLRIERDYDPSIPEVYGDADQLIQALLNIVRNAARAVTRQSGRILLRTRILRQFTVGHHCYRLVARIDVEDNGPGIPRHLRDRIFYPMSSTSAGGQGIGLSIAQSLVRQHGGLIECRSRPGQTVFSVFLPVEKPDVEG